MIRFPLPIQNNPLRTKDDLRLAFKQLTDPLTLYYSDGCAKLMLGATGTSYTADLAGMEGFSRILWGLIPLLAGGGESPLWDIYMKGIRNGTNPEHKEYWGAAGDYDQRSVEMAAFGLALATIPDKLLAGLGREGLEQLAAWLRPINENKLWDCNWVLFRVLVQIGFRKAGLPYDQELTGRTLDEIERFYIEEGWYADGVGGHSDYYVPFAIQYYGLLYAVLMEDVDPERSRLYKDRAVQFAGQFIHWFTEDGAALPYGRSLSYRFSQVAFWSAMAYAGLETPYSQGVMKGLIMRHLRWWFAQPIFTADGVLTIGYAYPNLVMAENYNAPGSPYWAMKTFLVLALPDDHPFWTTEELPLPELPAIAVQKAPHLVLCRQKEAGASHVVAFNSGHASSNEHTHTSAKYEKFAYSTFFGFSVPRAEWGLSQGAFDSMLALSEGDNQFRVKRRCEETLVQDDGIIFARWKPWADVEVKTWIIPGTPWHFRVHHVTTGRVLDAAEGGFALGIEGIGSGGRLPGDSGLPASPLLSGAGDGIACATYGRGASGVKVLYGSGAAELIYAQANTNVMVNRTVIPTVRTRIEAGTSAWLATAVYGEAFPEEADNGGQWSEAPTILVMDGELQVFVSGSAAPVFRVKLNG
jgi:hypothetical protein